MQDGWGRWQLGFHALFTLAANCPNLKELTISEEHLEVRPVRPVLQPSPALLVPAGCVLKVDDCLICTLCAPAQGFQGSELQPLPVCRFWSISYSLQCTSSGMHDESVCVAA